LRDDAGSIGRALALLGALALDQVMTGLEDGTVCWNDQQGGASYASKVTAAECVLYGLARAIEAHNKVRSVSPGLGVRTASSGLQFKVWRTWPYGGAGLEEPPTAAARVAGLPGTLAVDRDRLFVGCGDGALEFLEVQPAGRARMSAAEFLRGYGSRLGEALDLEPANP
jgi:methionyl-tRNA formyltransferase